MFENKPTLTKEQQDNVVRWIARSYEPIAKVQFEDFRQDNKTGMYLLSIKLNDNENFQTTISTRNKEEFDNYKGTIGLNPIDRFKKIERKVDLDENESIDIAKIKIIYLGE